MKVFWIILHFNIQQKFNIQRKFSIQQKFNIQREFNKKSDIQWEFNICPFNYFKIRFSTRILLNTH